LIHNVKLFVVVLPLRVIRKCSKDLFVFIDCSVSFILVIHGKLKSLVHIFLRC